MDPRLLITNIGYTFSLVFTLGIALFVLIKGKDRRLSVLFFLMSIAIAVYEGSHLLGINAATPELSRQIFMFNTANIFITIFTTHWILSLIGVEKKRALPLVLVYMVGVALFAFYLLYPQSLLLQSVPKWYLPNYYVPGAYDFLMRGYFILVGFYFIGELIGAYARSTDPVDKNRLKYVFFGVCFGFVVGNTAVPLVYDIPVDPLWSMFFSLYTLPFAYAILKYDLMDIRIVAKRAAFYSLFVGAVSLGISFLSFSNEWLVREVPGFPSWVLPLVSSVVAVSIAVFVWRKFRESDLLKYEFITIITHKFRTPLTRIKWATEGLLSAAKTPEEKHGLTDIKDSTESLVGLTNLLVALSNTEFTPERYRLERELFSPFVAELVAKNQERALRKGIVLRFVSGDMDLSVRMDKEKIGYVVQTIIENAITYTPAGGNINVTVSRKGKRAVCSVEDTGIGIAQDDTPRIFTKFFRTAEAKKADTEGMGIGLYMAKTIIERHGGTLTVFSEGPDKGSRFTISLPQSIVK